MEKNGKLRLCVDYRQLNNRKVKDSYALPRIEIFDCLLGAKYFTPRDMKSEYHQVEIEESRKERTAFTLTYYRLMEECLGSLNMTFYLIYMDERIILSNSFVNILRY